MISVVVEFLAELSVQAENRVTPESSAQLFTVSTEPLRPSLTHGGVFRKSPRVASTLPFNSESR